MVFATVMLNVCVPVAPAASSTVMVTLCDPTSSLVGVPVRTPVLAVKVSQDGADALSVSVSPLSTSAPVAVYVYTASSSTLVTAVLEMVGASLVFATVIVNESVTDDSESATVITTLCDPTSSLVGVPVSTPVLAVKDSQLGTVVPVIVSVSPSASSAVTV